jgi:hypothetical protein
MNPAEVLEKAADLLETVGWVQGEEVAYKRDPETGAKIPVGMCARGACMVAAGMDLTGSVRWLSQSESAREGFTAAFNLLQQAIEPTDDYGSLVGWNDHDGRTAAEVIEKMKQVAKDFRNTAAPEELS